MAGEELIIRIDLNNSKAKSSLNEIKKEGKNVGDSLENSFNLRITNSFSRSIASMSSSLLSLAGAIASIQTIRQSIQAFADFETGLVGVAKTTNASAQELESISLEISRLAQTIPVAQSELLQLAQVAGQFGIRGTRNISKFVEVVSKLNVATDLAGEEGAQSLVRILNVTGQGVKDLERFANVVVNLGNNIEGTESQIVAVTNEIARAGSIFNLTAEQAATLSAAIVATGGRAESAGTAIQTVFDELNKALLKGGERLKAFQRVFGLTADEINKIFRKDALETFRLFILGLNRIEESGGSAAFSLGQLGLNQRRLNRVILPLVNNYSKLQQTINLTNSEIKANNALSREAENAFNTLNSRLQLAGNAIKDLQVAIGTLLAPSVERALSGFTDLTKVVTDFFNSFREDKVGQLAKLNNEILSLSSQIDDLEERAKGQSIFSAFFAPPDPGVINALKAQFADLVKQRDALLDEVEAENKANAMATAMAKGVKEGIDAAPKPDFSKLVPSADEFRIELDEITNVIFPDFNLKTKEELDRLSQSLGANSDRFKEILNQQKEELKKFRGAVAQETSQIRDLFRSAIGQGVSSAFASFGKAIATGKNGLEALGQSVLQTLGSLAIQLGQFFILVGSGMTATGSLLGLSGSAAIAAGIGLSILGGILQGIAGGGAAGAEAGGGVGAANPPLEAPAAPEDITNQELERQTAVTVNVEGTVLDPVGVGQKIAEVLDEAFNAGASTIQVNTA